MPFAEKLQLYHCPAARAAKSGAFPSRSKESLILAEQYRKVSSGFYATFGEGEDYGLSRRELEIAACGEAFLTNREIAVKLHLAEGTVKNQLSRIFDKLEISKESKTNVWNWKNSLV